MRFRILIVLLAVTAAAQAGKHPNYDDDVKPVLGRRCFACHSASEMRSGLNLESYAGVLKGGGAGEAVKPGRPSASILYLAVSHEGEGVPRMPFGQPKIPDAEIAVIREWIQQGLLETASSEPRGPAIRPATEFKGSDMNRPMDAPAMPVSLAALTVQTQTRAHPVTALAASPWAPLIAVAEHERIAFYNLADRTPAGELAFPEGIPYLLRFSRDGSKLLAAGGKGVQSGCAVLFDVRTGSRLAVIGDEPDIVLAADISADGKLVAIGGPSRAVKVFSVASGKQAYEIKKHTDWITAIEFSPDNATIATGDRAGGIFLSEAARGSVILSLGEHKGAITSIDWRADGEMLASASEDGQIIIWNARDGFPAATIAKAHQATPTSGNYGNPPGGVLSVQFTPDGRVVSVGRDSTIRMWGIDGKQRGASSAFPSLLTKVAASYDNKLIVAGDYSGKLQYWQGESK